MEQVRVILLTRDIKNRSSMKNDDFNILNDRPRRIAIETRKKAIAARLVLVYHTGAM